MRLKLDQIPDEIGFSDGADLFGYEEFSKRLTRVIEKLEHPTTWVLDGPWGSGKSTFLRQWRAELKVSQHPVIFFDAFANDFFDEAFVPLSAEIIRLTQENIAVSHTVMETVKNSAEKAFLTLAPALAKAAVRAVSFGVIDYADVKDGTEKVYDAISNAFEDVAETAAREVLDRALQSGAVFQKFHDDLEALIELYRKNRLEAGLPDCPVIFVIDELDRCKPTFALNLVERIKHLFAIEGVVFLLVTNLEQLEAAVCSAYGDRTDATTYLEKFYDLRLSLPVVDGKDQVVEYVQHLKNNLSIVNGESEFNESVNSILVEFLRHQNVKLRTIEKIYSHIVINIASLGEGTTRPEPMIVGLCILRHLRPDLFQKARMKKLTWEEASDFFKFADWIEEKDWTPFCRDSWRYLTQESIDRREEWAFDISQYFRRFGAHKPQDFLARGAQKIAEFDIQ
ncbi:P-loop NTPase fold protein [Thalassospira sp. SN3W]|uniref:KAP family P-loop NTPase fold protein n=1 Tax=Thalassospira sp. SN3W TaxID=3035476 RepID=UPI00311B17DC